MLLRQFSKLALDLCDAIIQPMLSVAWTQYSAVVIFTLALGAIGCTQEFCEANGGADYLELPNETVAVEDQGIAIQTRTACVQRQLGAIELLGGLPHPDNHDA